MTPLFLGAVVFLWSGLDLTQYGLGDAPTDKELKKRILGGLLGMAFLVGGILILSMMIREVTK